ncbi:hypothetical protein FB446DRAFT_178556 [Lentinula raphanica]|nr:hypothetical protein FB446DRAFT_178556 [Lentinula raphanica]
MSQEFEVGHSAVPNAATTTVEKPIASPTTTIQPPWAKRHINLILIGDVDSGKTAMLDLLANVCAGVPLEDFKPVHKAANERDSSQPGSNTNVPEFYTISCANGNEVNILDTPGLGDLRGIEIDAEHRDAIVKAMIRHFETVDAIIILTNGALYRLSLGVKFVLNTLSSIFPHSIVNNVAFVLTMVSDPTMIGFKRSYLPIELKDAKVWDINNPFAQWTRYQKKLAENPRALPEDLLEEINDSIHRDYSKTLTTLSEVFQFLDKCEVQSMESAYSFKEKPDVEAAIPNVIAGTNETESTHNELEPEL